MTMAHDRGDDGQHGGDSGVDGRLDWRFKGWPSGAPPLSIEAVGKAGWSILREDVMLPAAVLDAGAIRHNSDWMRRFTALAGVGIAPHGKTTMSPDLFRLQIADGAWGITAATAAHLRIYREHGMSRIIYANQLIGRQAIDYVVGELLRDPGFDFYCLIDSIDAIERLEAGVAHRLAGCDRKLQVLLELGMPGGRTGVRDDAEALRIAERVAASPLLSLRGVEAFEGIVQGNAATGEADIRGILGRMTEVAERCRERGLFTGRPILTAGGSSFFDVVAAMLNPAKTGEPFEVILRSGCYLVHDSHFYARLIEKLIARSPEAASLGTGLRSALEVWAYVHSRPEPTRLIAGLGKRDTSADVSQPVPLRWYRPGSGMAAPEPVAPGASVIRLDDQHAYLDIPSDSPLQVGDMVAFGISHPCTTFDRWPYLYLVDEALEITGAIRTFF
ncbi:MAG: amino acid deaminase [Pseudomonadota bacterium]